jgi:hypothetical protein
MIAQPREATLAFLSASGPKKLDHYFYTGIVPFYQTDITGKHRYPSAQKNRSRFRVQGLGGNPVFLEAFGRLHALYPVHQFCKEE